MYWNCSSHPPLKLRSLRRDVTHGRVASSERATTGRRLPWTHGERDRHYDVMRERMTTLPGNRNRNLARDETECDVIGEIMNNNDDYIIILCSISASHQYDYVCMYVYVYYVYLYISMTFTGANPCCMGDRPPHLTPTMTHPTTISKITRMGRENLT